jgi:argininosuccinate synthase (EC 6.3.4.5)
MVKKVVLAYSGGLDTSVILKWLQDQYQCDVVTFTADIGQGEELEPARAKAEKLGAREIFIDDLRQEFVSDYVFPMFRANTLYEGEYLLGTSIARPLIAKRMVEIAADVGADAVAHGATGKGNDQVRFELGAYALNPNIQVIAPWREWDLNSREKLLAYAERHGIPVERHGKKSPYSMDANLLHISYEGGVLEDPWAEAEDGMWRWTTAPEQAPDQPRYLEITYAHGDPIAIDGEAAQSRAIAGAPQRRRRRAWHRTPGYCRKPLRRHEIPGLLRDSRRHHSAQGPSRYRIHHPGPGSRPSQG